LSLALRRRNEIAFFVFFLSNGGSSTIAYYTRAFSSTFSGVNSFLSKELSGVRSFTY